MKLLIIVTLIAAGVIAFSEELPLARSEAAKTAAFAVDTEKPFHFELGRGSGMDGLDTVAFGHDGDVKIFRQHPQGKWQTATLKLAPIAITRIFDVVKTKGIMDMPSEFHANVDDGAQWVLWINQDQKSKAIYFNNHFPPGIKSLAEQVDRELADAGLAKAEWQAVIPKNFREHEKLLWESIE